MRKCLFVTFYFPPFEGIASLRPGKFAKFLPEFGWEPLVLTVDEIPGLRKTLPVEMKCGKIFRTGWVDVFSPFKKTLTGSSEGSVEKSVKSNIVRKFVKLLKSPFEAGFVRLPDRTFFWIFPAVRKGIEIIKNEKPDVIISCGGPVSSHIIAYVLSKKSGIPWIADYRDLWSNNYFFKRNLVIDSIERGIEKFFMKRVSAITTVAEELAEYLRMIHRKDVYVITNGFDDEDYEFEVEKKDEKFHIVYTGNIYPGKRDMDFFFRALKESIKDAKISPDELSVDFYSYIYGKIPELIEKFDLREFVKLHPFLPHEECRRVQKSADVLLILDSPEESMKGVATGKIFEYLAAGRPILAVGPKGGAVERILMETNAGILLDNEEDLKDFFKKIITLKEKAFPFVHDREKIKKYSRRSQTAKMAELLERIYSKRTT